MSVETAIAVLDRHRRDQRRQEAAKLRKDIAGRYFKYRNRFSSDDSWWLYAHVESVDSFGTPIGFSFERCSNDEVRVNLSGSRQMTVRPGGGWVEITSGEFNRAARRLSSVVAKQLKAKKV